MTDDDLEISARWLFLNNPELAKKIRGSTGFFFIDLEEGDLFCIVEQPDGKMANLSINECYKKGYKHVAPVLELIPGGKAGKEALDK